MSAEQALPLSVDAALVRDIVDQAESRYCAALQGRAVCKGQF